jgi:hypothetical protein
MEQTVAKIASAQLDEALRLRPILRRYFENLIESLLFLSATVSVLTTLGNVVILAVESARFFQQV